MDNADTDTSNYDESPRKSSPDYLRRAANACEEGDFVLGVYLYLAAEEAATEEGSESDETHLGLKQAWALACEHRERSLAEHILERMEPYLSAEEMTVCAEELQEMAFDKLEEIGLSREDLEEMASAISQDVLDGEVHDIRFDRFSVRSLPGIEVRGACFNVPHPSALSEKGKNEEKKSSSSDTAAGSSEGDNDVDVAFLYVDEDELTCDSAAESSSDKPLSDLHRSAASSPSPEGPSDQRKVGGEIRGDKPQKSSSAADGRSAHPDGDDAATRGRNSATSKSASSKSASAESSRSSGKPQVSFPRKGQSPADYLARIAQEMEADREDEEKSLSYADLAGYENAIQVMRDMGIGLQHDEGFQRLVGLLNVRHGLERMPALDTILFCSPCREDANRFIAATLGELDLPVLRMHMEENLAGMPLLCVSAQAKDGAKFNMPRNLFEQGGILVLEDIDLWGSPLSDIGDEAGNLLIMQLTRGAREAVNLIRSAVENPDVYVLASASVQSDIDPFFLDMLEPLSLLDIDLPTAEERFDIWMQLAREHPSLRSINRRDLVRLSANLSRFDIYMAVREALEESYKMGLATRQYQPVKKENIFDKLAAFQPLDSFEYHELEEEVIEVFRSELDCLEDLLDDAQDGLF